MIGCNLSLAQFRNTLVANLDLAGSHGIGSVLVESIDVGSDAEPHLLTGEEARDWLQRLAASPVRRRWAKDWVDWAREYNHE